VVVAFATDAVVAVEDEIRGIGAFYEEMANVGNLKAEVPNV
jgi:hypothetical protein